MVTKYNLSDLKELLLNSSENSKLNVSNVSNCQENDARNLIIYQHYLCIEHEKLVNKFADKFNLKMISSLT